MGQARPVQIVNFVSKGTIEEGMLSVLAFKRSLSAGILDGGTGEISLGGSRLNRFMKDVENVTGRMGAGEPMTRAEETPGAAVAGDVVRESDRQGDADVALNRDAVETVPDAPLTPAPAASAAVDPWQALVQIGAQLVSAMTAASDSSAPAHPWIEQDPNSGARTLRVPLPPPETARQIADALSVLAATLRRNG